MLKDKERAIGLGDKIKEECLVENLKFNYGSGRVSGDEECVLSESNVKLRNELGFWKKKVQGLEEEKKGVGKEMGKLKDDNYY